MTGHSATDSAAEERERILRVLEDAYEAKRLQARGGVSNVVRSLNAHYLAGFEDAIRMVKESS